MRLARRSPVVVVVPVVVMVPGVVRGGMGCGNGGAALLLFQDKPCSPKVKPLALFRASPPQLTGHGGRCRAY